jgi:hypothetical protein
MMQLRDSNPAIGQYLLDRQSTGAPQDMAYTRTIIIHYHIFKNAGTSVDEMLRQNFGPGWAESEFKWGRPRHSNVEQVASYLRDHPELCALSSHTARPPPPSLGGVRIFPILFLRDPIDRIRSVYEFQRTQHADTFGARIAKELDFKGFLRAHLAKPHARQVRNFQTYFLSSNESPRFGSERDRALRALISLPFIGLVEAYEQSLMLLEAALKPMMLFRAIHVEKNRTVNRAPTLAERLHQIESELGSTFYKEICDANMNDLELHRLVAKRYSYL